MSSKTFLKNETEELRKKFKSDLSYNRRILSYAHNVLASVSSCFLKIEFFSVSRSAGRIATLFCLLVQASCSNSACSMDMWDKRSRRLILFRIEQPASSETLLWQFISQSVNLVANIC